jgi:hypothetical protein
MHKRQFPGVAEPSGLVPTLEVDPQAMASGHREVPALIKAGELLQLIRDARPDIAGTSASVVCNISLSSVTIPKPDASPTWPMPAMIASDDSESTMTDGDETDDEVLDNVYKWRV